MQWIQSKIDHARKSGARRSLNSGFQLFILQGEGLQGRVEMDVRSMYNLDQWIIFPVSIMGGQLWIISGSTL